MPSEKQDRYQVTLHVRTADLWGSSSVFIWAKDEKEAVKAARARLGPMYARARAVVEPDVSTNVLEQPQNRPNRLRDATRTR